MYIFKKIYIYALHNCNLYHYINYIFCTLHVDITVPSVKIGWKRMDPILNPEESPFLLISRGYIYLCNF